MKTYIFLTLFLALNQLGLAISICGAAMGGEEAPYEHHVKAAKKEIGIGGANFESLRDALVFILKTHMNPSLTLKSSSILQELLGNEAGTKVRNSISNGKKIEIEAFDVIAIMKSKKNFVPKLFTRLGEREIALREISKGFTKISDLKHFILLRMGSEFAHNISWSQSHPRVISDILSLAYTQGREAELEQGMRNFLLSSSQKTAIAYRTYKKNRP